MGWAGPRRMQSAVQSDMLTGADLTELDCIIAIAHNICLSALARKSTSIASKPFLAMTPIYCF